VIGFGVSQFASSVPLAAILYPEPLLVAIPSLLFGGAWGHSAAYLAIFVPALLFWAWSVQLFRGEPNLPLRSALLFWALVALSAVYFVAMWEFGLQSQGNVHVVSVAAFNVAALVALWWLLTNARSKPLFRRSLGFHLALFAWLAWFAFPFLGESL
jgi:hypothetical protein